ncbi:MAG TPA: polyketide cyclase/dehydrase and lipid transport, partial [Candidatus Aminicenantes bacterium]|nr:polyketide cyclase/dehydrase and lipid transport [Candidatus Aminicenantes bacterium]
MARVEVDRSAPAVGSAEAPIEAPVETVWEVLSDLENWPRWNKSVSRIRINGSVEAGTSFEWASGGFKIVSRLEEVAPPARIAWTGKMFGVRAVHVWELAERGRSTHARTEESFEGWLAKLFPGLMKRTLAKALDQGLAALKTEA